MWQVQQRQFYSCFELFYFLEEETVTNTVNTRALVLEMLMAINEDGQYSHLVLRDVLDKYQYLSKQERAFLTRLTEERWKSRSH